MFRQTISVDGLGGLISGCNDEWNDRERFSKRLHALQIVLLLRTDYLDGQVGKSEGSIGRGASEKNGWLSAFSAVMRFAGQSASKRFAKSKPIPLFDRSGNTLGRLL